MKTIRLTSKVGDMKTVAICPLCGLELDPDEYYERVDVHVFYEECQVSPLLYLSVVPDRFADRVYKDMDGDLWLLQVMRDYDLAKLGSFTPTEPRLVANLIWARIDQLATQINFWRETLKILEKGEK